MTELPIGLSSVVMLRRRGLPATIGAPHGVTAADGLGAGGRACSHDTITDPATSNASIVRTTASTDRIRWRFCEVEGVRGCGGSVANRRAHPSTTMYLFKWLELLGEPLWAESGIGSQTLFKT